MGRGREQIDVLRKYFDSLSVKAETSTLNYLWANLIVEELYRNGIKRIFLGSGSRCTPLTVAVAEHQNITDIVHFDERSLGYLALGASRTDTIPSAIITTSGTAVANLFPAVVEAAMDHIPLIILSADRPPELRDCGANQAIDQVNIYGKYVKWSFDLPCPNFEICPETILTTIDQAVHQSKFPYGGPVQINCMFREPFFPNALLKLPVSENNADSESSSNNIQKKLAPLIPFQSKTTSPGLKKENISAPSQSSIENQELLNLNLDRYLKGLNSWVNGNEPYTKTELGRQLIANNILKELAEKIRSIADGLLVIGNLKSSEEVQSVVKLMDQINWPAYADITSGIQLGFQCNALIAHFNHFLLNPKFLSSYRPSLILHIGGRLTSKHYQQFAKSNQPRHYYWIQEHHLRNNPEHCAGTYIQNDITSFCQALYKKVEGVPKLRSPWLAKLKEGSQNVDEYIDQKLQESERLSEPEVARLISKHIPQETGLFLGASMPIRDMDMFAKQKGKLIKTIANRGASGIDGTIASAAGFAQTSRKLVTVFLGDLSLLHDLNSLSLIHSIDAKLVIVVINNSGGGIFSFLPISSFHGFEKYFGTPHPYQFQKVAEMFQLEYAFPKTSATFVKSYKKALRIPKSCIIEVKTDRQQNVKIHESIASGILDVTSKLCNEELEF